MSDAIAALSEASAKRQKQEGVFQRLANRAMLLAERKDETLVPLQLSAWTERRKRMQEEVDRLEVDLDDGPARMKVTTVGVTWTRRDPKATEAWQKNLARDPWLLEAVHVAADMTSAAR